ncbi:MAG: signal recognition particle-docking protein FtsY, partial [Myxococcota bacterium]
AEQKAQEKRAEETAAAAEAKRAEEERERAEAEPKSLREGLGKTRKEGFIARISRIFTSKELEEDVVDQLEEVLFTADIGVKTADRLLDAVRGTLSGRDMGDLDRIWEVLRMDAQVILREAADNDRRTEPAAGQPRVIMILGVNGSGKTTTIGKLAHQLVREGKDVRLVAGDTFRAAAAEQLEQWGRRVGAPVFRGKEGADPGSVVFDGVRQAAEDGADVVLVDTAGRLHTQVNLMEELKKVYRVTDKALPGAPHEVLLVLDATTGQNAIQQAQMFGEACQVTGIVLTKLDGTAKGGIVLGVCDEMRIPIRYVGVGERVEDLRLFQPDEFVEALFAS